MYFCSLEISPQTLIHEGSARQSIFVKFSNMTILQRQILMIRVKCKPYTFQSYSCSWMLQFAHGSLKWNFDRHKMEHEHNEKKSNRTNPLAYWQIFWSTLQYKYMPPKFTWLIFSKRSDQISIARSQLLELELSPVNETARRLVLNAIGELLSRKIVRKRLIVAAKDATVWCNFLSEMHIAQWQTSLHSYIVNESMFMHWHSISSTTCAFVCMCRVACSIRTFSLIRKCNRESVYRSGLAVWLVAMK